MRVGEARGTGDVDRDRVGARVDDPAVDQDRALALVDREAQVLLTRHQEVAHVEARLKADDVAPEQADDDRIAHLARQHLPVLRRRPGDVHEVLDYRAVQLLADQLRHEVELVVVDHDERPAR